MVEPLNLETMILRLLVAVLLGAVIGFERELVGKRAGVRTDIMVSAGAAVFSIVGLMLPHIISTPDTLSDVLSRNSGFLTAIANVVIGVGFLGAGIIVKEGIQVRGLTTAASVWYVAAIGVLCGIGLLDFAAIAAIGMAILLFVLRKIDLYHFVDKSRRGSDSEEETS